jgi:DNA-binding GntR family transcriptional regulator
MADVERETGMARVTARKVIDSLVERKLIAPTRKVGKAQLFKLNKGNAVVVKLLELDKQLSFEYADKAAEKGVAKTVA